MKVAIYTLGCKVNQYETAALENALRARGHALVPFEGPADAYIINTCTVTAVSDKKSRQAIRQAPKRAPGAVVAVCGCYAQTAPGAVEALGVDLIAGTAERMQFLDDLEQIAKCKSITIRMNSYGGDAGVSNTIHNRLRELARNGAELICVVDGVAMSGGSLIMCACDTVRVNPSSLIMIHKCWSYIWGDYNADELRQMADQNDAWDKMQITIYKRKTGLSDTVLSHMMADTTYMTGKEAVDKGFADEVLEDAEPLNITASVDGRSLFVRGRTMRMEPGTFAPDTIPTVNALRLRQMQISRRSPADKKEEIP